ncbi:hypothetical protein ACQKFU_33615, partial [Bacillus mycoides]|uniref:hypothetical protein n=1 Tax=Bacillus mycoides TaxID=1405 RepID=UPI003CFBD0C6
AMPNRNSSPTYRWATPFTRLRKENSFGEFVKIKQLFSKSKERHKKSNLCEKIALFIFKQFFVPVFELANRMYFIPLYNKKVFFAGML